MQFPRVFILSPAHCGGERARILLRDEARFPLAQQLRSPEGISLAEAFSFLSGLYFRGKIAYADAFARPPRRIKESTLVITTNRGLLPAHHRITIDDLRCMGEGDIDADDPVYRSALERDAAVVSESLGRTGRVILLGSIASGKYCDILLKFFGSRLLFPQEFVGRGDMSRGGLMLRCVDLMQELTYVPIDGAIRRGSRPPRLAKRVKPAI